MFWDSPHGNIRPDKEGLRRETQFNLKATPCITNMAGEPISIRQIAGLLDDYIEE